MTGVNRFRASVGPAGIGQLYDGERLILSGPLDELRIFAADLARSAPPDAAAVEERLRLLVALTADCSFAFHRDPFDPEAAWREAGCQGELFGGGLI